MNKEQLKNLEKNIEPRQKYQSESPQSYLDEEIQKQLKEQLKSNNSIISQNRSNNNSYLGASNNNSNYNNNNNNQQEKNNTSKYSSTIINNNSEINTNNLKEKAAQNKKITYSRSQNSPNNLQVKNSMKLKNNQDENNNNSRSDSINEHGKLVEQIFELFFALRTNLDEDTSLSVRNKIPLEETVEEVCEMDPFTVFYYIRVIIDATFKLKDELQDMMEKQAENDISEYESQLQKAEAEIRNHISVEQQLKLYYENQQQRLEESEVEKVKEIEQLKKKIEKFEMDQKKINENMKDLEKRLEEKENKIKEISSDYQKKSQTLIETEKKNKQFQQQIKELEQEILQQKSNLSNQQQQINQMNQRNNTISQQQLYRKQLVKGQDIMYDPQEIIQKKLQESQKNKQQQQQSISQQSHYQNLNQNQNNKQENREVFGMNHKNTSKSSQNLKNNQNNSINKYKQLKSTYQYNLEDDNGLYQYLQEKMLANKGSKNGEDLFNKVKKLQNALEKKLQPQTHRGDIVHTEGNDRTERIRGQSINHIHNTSTNNHNQSTKRSIKRGGSSYNLNRTHQIYANTSFSQKQNNSNQRGHLQQSSKLIKERSKTINTSKFNFLTYLDDNSSNLNSIHQVSKKSKNGLYEKSPNRSFSKTYRNNSQQHSINNHTINSNTIAVMGHNNHIQNNINLGKTQNIKDHLLTIDHNNNKQNKKSVDKLKAFIHPSPYSQNNQNVHNVSKKSKKKSQNLSYQQ